MTARIPVASIDATTVPLDRVPDLWRQSIAPFFDSSPLDSSDPARLLMRQYHLGGSLFVESRFGARSFVRDSAWMARNDDADHLLVQVFLSGVNRVSNGDDCYVQQRGAVFGVNLARTVNAQSTDSEVLSLVLPREHLGRTLPHLIDSGGALTAAGSISAHIFTDYMETLRRSLSQTCMDEVSMINDSMIALLDALVVHGDPAAGASVQATFSVMAKYVERNLQNPDLSVDSLCAAFRCSRATVYRVFADHGGVVDYIRRRRLTACYKALCGAKHAHRRIFDVALDYGFASPSHFSALFRDHFGMTPRQARESARAGVVPDYSGAHETAEYAETMQLWARTLNSAG